MIINSWPFVISFGEEEHWLWIPIKQNMTFPKRIQFFLCRLVLQKKLYSLLFWILWKHLWKFIFFLGIGNLCNIFDFASWTARTEIFSLWSLTGRFDWPSAQDECSWNVGLRSNPPSTWLKYTLNTYRHILWISTYSPIHWIPIVLWGLHCSLRPDVFCVFSVLADRPFVPETSEQGREHHQLQMIKL